MTASDENTLMLAANFREAYEARTRLRDSHKRRELWDKAESPSKGIRLW